MFRSRVADHVFLTLSAVCLSAYGVRTELATPSNQAACVYGLMMLYLAVVLSFVRHNNVTYGWFWGAMLYGGFAATIVCFIFYPPLGNGYIRTQDPAGEPLFWTSVFMIASSILGFIGWVFHNLKTCEPSSHPVPREQ